MEGIKANLCDEVAALRDTFIERAAQVDTVMKTHFPQEDLGAVEAAMQALVTAAPSASNDAMVKAISAVRQQTSVAVTALGKIELVVCLSTPTIEDGGNFGVAVQEDVLKLIKGLRAALSATMGKFAEYYKARAEAVDKIAATSESSKKTTTETKSNEVKAEGAEKKPAETKEATTTVVESSSSTKPVTPDAVMHVVAIDVNMYVTLKQSLESVMHCYLITADVIAKNEAKVFAPKGDGGGNPMTMF